MGFQGVEGVTRSMRYLEISIFRYCMSKNSFNFRYDIQQYSQHAGRSMLFFAIPKHEKSNRSDFDSRPGIFSCNISVVYTKQWDARVWRAERVRCDTSKFEILISWFQQYLEMFRAVLGIKI